MKGRSVSVVLKYPNSGWACVSTCNSTFDEWQEIG